MEEYVAMLTYELLEICKNDIELKFDQIKNTMVLDLTNSIKIDIINKIYSDDITSEYKTFNNCFDDNYIIPYIIENAAKYGKHQGHLLPNHQTWIKNALNFIKNKMINNKDNIIYCNAFIRVFTVSEAIYSPSTTRYTIYLYIITDLSNVIYISKFIQITDYGGPQINYMNFSDNDLKINNYNTKLHPIFIKLLQDILINCDSDIILQIITNIIKLNKDIQIKLLTKYDIQKQNEILTKQLIESKNKIEEQFKEINDLKEQLKNNVPIQYQCCICFGFTNKEKIIIPCGHTNYCNSCIFKIHECALCKIKIDKVISIYK